MKQSFFNSIDMFHISYMEQKIEYNMTGQHYHNGYEFMLIIDGVRHVFYGNEMKELTKGDLLIISPFVPHYTETPKGQTFKRFLLNTSEDYFDDVLTDEEKNDLFSDIHTGVIHLNEDDFKTILGLYNNLDNVLARKHTVSKLKLFKMHIACFIQEISFLAKSYMIDFDEPNKINNFYFSKAIEYINKHYTEEITLDFIAKYVHMSKSNFCLMFKKETGNTFLSYLQLLRSTKAHKLLINTDYSIEKVAETVGFSSIQQMERVFNSLYKKTPREMRKAEI